MRYNGISLYLTFKLSVYHNNFDSHIIAVFLYFYSYRKKIIEEKVNFVFPLMFNKRN